MLNIRSHQPGHFHGKMAIVVMSTSLTILRFWLLSFLLFFVSHISFGDDQAIQVHRIGWSCERTANNTASIAYSFNLCRLSNPKLYDESGNSIYSNATYGENPDKVYGLYLCRGDVTTQTCQTCTNAAIDTLVKECEGTKSGIAWYDECLLRYPNRYFSSAFESVPAVTMSNEKDLNVSDPVAFQKALNQSFNQLIANETSGKLKYAANIVNISNSVTLYTLGQCIPYLSKEDCRACLSSAAQLMESEKLSSRYLYPSCNTRFELYLYFRTSSIATSPPLSLVQPQSPPPPVSDKTGVADGCRKRICIPISISISGVVVLLRSLLWYMHRRNKRNKGEKQVESQEFPLFPEDLTLKATQNFCDENKVQEGGFGPMYKGVLPDGNEIAVNRILDTSGQGLKEFKNEVTLIARL